MTVIIRKTDTPAQIQRKLKRAAAAAGRLARKTKGFPAHKFSGKRIFGNIDGMAYQKQARDEWQ